MLRVALCPPLIFIDDRSDECQTARIEYKSMRPIYSGGDCSIIRTADEHVALIVACRRPYMCSTLPLVSEAAL